jgi:uncharacterized Fe-S cluster-containing radical SAM superfamily protein
MAKKNKQGRPRGAQPLSEEEIQELSKIAFANMADFARFEANGRVHIFDQDKAREIGAKVSVTTRTVGRGKNAREVRTTKITMPDKFRALMKLYDHFVTSKPRKG